MFRITFKNATSIIVDSKVVSGLSDFIRKKDHSDLYIHNGGYALKGDSFGPECKMIRISEIVNVEQDALMSVFSEVNESDISAKNRNHVK